MKGRSQGERPRSTFRRPTPLEVARDVAIPSSVLDNLVRRQGSGAGFGAAARVFDAKGRTLLVRLQPGGWTTEWMTPGGGSEPGESPVETVTREVLEETGVRLRDLRPWKVLHNTYVDPQGRRVRFDFYQFTARGSAPLPRTRVPEEIAEVRWFERLPKRMAFRSDWVRPPPRERRARG